MKKNSLGDALIEAGAEALQVVRKEKVVREKLLEVNMPPKWTKRKILRLRKEKFGVSQAVFALYLNVSKKTVEAWEQGKNTPNGSSSRLLQVFASESVDWAQYILAGKN